MHVGVEREHTQYVYSCIDFRRLFLMTFQVSAEVEEQKALQLDPSQSLSFFI